MFEREPGVFILKRPKRKPKRRYRSIRIPRVVYERIVKRLTVKCKARYNGTSRFQSLT
jgi:hypothetical protein